MFSGSLIALITPFRHHEVDEEALRALVHWHIAEGSQGLVPVGTTGESPTLSAAEHRRVVEIVVGEANGKIPVIAGAGSNNPAEAIAYAQHAQQVGADALLCVAGYYNRPSQEGLYRHFKQLHDATDLPMIIYNIPPRTIVDITPPTMARLAELPRVVGVKDATTDLSRCSRERRLIDKTFSYLSGEDITALAYNSMGGNGCISAAANLVPKQCRALQDACAGNDYKTALEIHEQLVPLYDALFVEPSPAGVKYGASLLGLCSEECRVPVVPLQVATQSRIRQALFALNDKVAA